MQTSTLVKSAALGIALSASASVWATECSDITWKSEILEEYAQINEACHGIVEKNGREYVKLEAKVLRSVGNRVHLKFKHTDGSYGETYETPELPKDFRVDVEGRKRSIHSLPRDYEVNIFMPTDRFVIFPSMEQPEVQEIAADDSRMTMLPSTASHLPLIALLGSIFCVLGLALRRLRG